MGARWGISKVPLPPRFFPGERLQMINSTIKPLVRSCNAVTLTGKQRASGSPPVEPGPPA
jgi:hypothetical protein